MFPVALPLKKCVFRWNETAPLELNLNIRDWLLETVGPEKKFHIPHGLRIQQMMHELRDDDPGKWVFFLSNMDNANFKAIFDFDELQHATLFKLTWGGQ